MVDSDAIVGKGRVFQMGVWKGKAYKEQTECADKVVRERAYVYCMKELSEMKNWGRRARFVCAKSEFFFSNASK